jgi:hypothetical protein
MVIKEDSSKKELKKKPMTKEELEEALIHNFIALQKALTNMTVKFDELSTNISKLLQLFEISAKSFAEKYSSIDENKEGTDKEFIKRLDALMDQNKVISKGIMLIEEKIREKNSMNGNPNFNPNIRDDPRNNPRINNRVPPNTQGRY